MKKQDPIVLPKDINEACVIFEKAILEEALNQNIDLTLLDTNFDVLGPRRHLVFTRYIRARKYRLEDCKNMLINSLKWRLVTKPASLTTDDVLEIAKRDHVFFS